MKNEILIIDGENFKYKVKAIIKANDSQNEGLNFLDLDIGSLFNEVLKDNRLSERYYYSAKLHPHKETDNKSRKLIEEQRRLKRKLVDSGFKFIMSGHVRVRESIDNLLKKKTYVFYEKGVDVRMAVDLVSHAYEKTAGIVYLCSSDSDLQPAIYKSRKKGLKVIYIGFEDSSNIGLTKTTDDTILIKKRDVVKCLNRTNP